MQMHQVDVTKNYEWNSLVASKPKECITYATQEFVIEDSLLAKKRHDKIVSFPEVKKWALELVPELGPSFEEAKKEKVQEEEERKQENEDKGKKQLLLQDAKEMSTSLEGKSRLVVETYWALCFWIRSCARRTIVPILVYHQLHKVQNKMYSGERKSNRKRFWKRTLQCQQRKISYNRERNHVSPKPEDTTQLINMRRIQL
jgi:hypothetical protein